MYKALIPLFAVVLLASCSSVKVTSDYDKNADFNQYKTYGFLGWQENSDQIMTRFDRERLESAFRDEFTKRGMTLVDENPDAMVALFIVVDQKTSVSAYTNHYGAYGGYYYDPWAWGGGHSTTTYNEYDYEVGTLVCDVFDAGSKKLVWQGVGSGTVDDNPKSREKHIPKTVALIMNSYPIKPVQ